MLAKRKKKQVIERDFFLTWGPVFHFAALVSFGCDWLRIGYSSIKDSIIRALCLVPVYLGGCYATYKLMRREYRHRDILHSMGGITRGLGE